MADPLPPLPSVVQADGSEVICCIDAGQQELGASYADLKL